MIKIGERIRVSVAAIALFVMCFSLGKAEGLCITYTVMLLHEIAHLIAAVCIGLKIDCICFYAFGVNLKLKNKMIYSICDEIILYFSGPLLNAIFALVSLYLYKNFHNEYLSRFYISNLMLFCMNMLPAIPLDGGILLKKIMAYAIGYRKAEKVMRVISAVVSPAVAAVGIAVLCKTRFNFSILLFSSLMIGNIFTQTEKYNTDVVKMLMFPSRKKKNVRHIISEEEIDCNEIIKSFIPKDFNVVYITNKDGKIEKILTETQIINKLMDKM